MPSATHTRLVVVELRLDGVSHATRATRHTVLLLYHYYYYYYYHHHHYYYYYHHGLPRREAIEAERRVSAVRQ